LDGASLPAGLTKANLQGANLRQANPEAKDGGNPRAKLTGATMPDGTTQIDFNSSFYFRPTLCCESMILTKVEATTSNPSLIQLSSSFQCSARVTSSVYSKSPPPVDQKRFASLCNGFRSWPHSVVVSPSTLGLPEFS